MPPLPSPCGSPHSFLLVVGVGDGHRVVDTGDASELGMAAPILLRNDVAVRLVLPIVRLRNSVLMLRGLEVRRRVGGDEAVAGVTKAGRDARRNHLIVHSLLPADAGNQQRPLSNFSHQCEVLPRAGTADVFERAVDQLAGAGAGIKLLITHKKELSEVLIDGPELHQLGG